MQTQTTSSLDRYRLLGRSGLRVSPIALGAMTFGTDWGWGADPGECRRILDAYVDRGGNFVDTANKYTNGSSETILGELAKGRRDRLVIATKYTLTTSAGDPNSGGNHRKSMVRSVETSLRRLASEHVDILYLHAWDDTTPADEILRAMDDLVRAGKVLYVAISDTPAWHVSRMQAIAELRGWSPFVALQVPYSLVERTVERELLPMARALGIGVVPWGLLGMGVLSGKYTKADLSAGSGTPTGSRKDVAASNGTLTERGLAIADVVKEVARELDRTPSQIAIAWTLQNPAVTSPIVGARTLAQLEENLGALEVRFAADQLARLDAASAITLGFPTDFLSSPMTTGVVFGGTKIEPRR